ncbi:protein-L-isoaspartate O-methyltransferase [Geobacter sp. OR-1]|uniref:class I SAM-dependent methyltransferase n=1 Tax=Geobacter sp. OR-1 TaxID=1266765 RepID=UPI0005424D6D|nr:methyltransferase domain-containing protein [Geobacter sp. OR-1]GAM08021.1 protein-L-isoaspartate O-methyltransferase [Geobacter sp. OR-1]
MALTTDIVNALSLLFHGEWREFIFRIRVHLQKIDLRNSYLAELQLPEERCHYYANSGGLHLAKVLDSLKITPQDAIVDFGSGKGGALITMSHYPFARIMGVEISPELVAIARRNLAKLGIANAEMRVSDATNFLDLDGYNYFYFFSPFPGHVMESVIRNISNSLVKAPRKVTIIYFNPEYHEAIVTNSPFVKVAELHHHALDYYIYTNRDGQKVSR